VGPSSRRPSYRAERRYQTSAVADPTAVPRAAIARRLRDAAGLSDEPTGVVANDAQGLMSRVKDAVA
jgi:hypothetical protein